MAIGILNQYGELDAVPETRKEEAIHFLRSTQDPSDGYFKDPLVTEADHVGNHSWEQVYGQWSNAEEALHQLGGQPKHPMPRKRFVDLNEFDGTAFTRSFDWTNPWANGESWTRAIRAYVDHLPAEVRAGLPEQTPERLREAYETFEAEILDPETGYPLRQMTDPNLSHAMAGAFKTFGGYRITGRPWPHPERAIDTTLDLQHDDGEFGYRGNMCINWDSLWLLRHMNIQLDGGYRFDEIVAAGERTARMLMNRYRKPDGAFAFHGDRCQTNHHSIVLCDEARPISDMLGTMMCLHCLAYADEWNEAAQNAAPAGAL